MSACWGNNDSAWSDVQDAITRYGEGSAEAAGAMIRYRASQTAQDGHATPDEMWASAGRKPGSGWERIAAPPVRRRPLGEHFDPRIDFPERYENKYDPY